MLGIKILTRTQRFLWLKSSMVSVLVNESPMDHFKMKKGLRQGDLLALFLFLIVAEGLNALMCEWISDGKRQY